MNKQKQIKKDWETYLNKYSEIYKTPRWKIIKRRTFIFLLVFALIGLLTTGALITATVAFAATTQEQKSDLLKIVIEHRVSQDDLNLIRNYIINTIQELKGGNEK